MRLSEFIQDTLFEIASGVEAARVRARNMVAINPSRLDGEQLTEKSYIEFDVSVVVNESSERESGGEARVSGKISVASVAEVGASIGGQRKGSTSASAEHTHRVLFKVPVYLNANYRDNPAAQAEAAAFENLSAKSE